MMKRTMLGFALITALAAVAQPPQCDYAFDNLRLTQTELRGSSRFQSMAGAFGALGGDISTLNQNPAGIGVYRSSDVGITLSLDLNSSKSPSITENQTKFNLNNFGYVGAIKLDSETMPNFNWGISYNRLMHFDRRYRGVGQINTSITNYLAEKTMSKEIKVSDMNVTNPYDNSIADWNQVMAYNNYLIIPTNYEGTHFAGLGFDGVTAYGEYEMRERGHADEFSINLGGNIANTLYWGIGLGITDLLYEYDQYYGESLANTEVYNRPDDPTAQLVDGDMDLGFTNWSRTTGTGYNFKFGVIVKPVNEIRFGVAFHTPTYYSLTDRYSMGLSTAFYPLNGTSYNLPSENTQTYRQEYDLRTPWRLIGSIAGVIGAKGIISADYEYVGTNNIRVKNDWAGGYKFTENEWTTQDVKDYLQGQHIIRVGAEYRVTPKWSLRAGYSYQTSSTKDVVKEDRIDVNVCGISTAYTYDLSTQYMTAGFGYHHKNVYFDMSYVHKYRKNNYHLFPGIVDLPTVYDEVKDHNNRISATLGFRF